MFNLFQIHSVYQCSGVNSEEGFILHSGKSSQWKIECDSLTSEDWSALALMASEILGPFGAIEGVPRGGLIFAERMKPYIVNGCDRLLIVDDVLTTGGSMEQHRNNREAIGCVIFAREKCPDWIIPIFQMPLGRNK